jgi:hypothetical protein
MRKHMYLRQKWAVGYWKVEVQPCGAHTLQNSNIHIWVMRRAFGGKTPKQAEHCGVSQIFCSDECQRVPFRKLPRTWRNSFRREAR